MGKEQKITGGCVPVTRLELGLIENNVFIIDDGAGCMVVDPSCDEQRIVEALAGRALDAIIITHAHWDHLGAASALRAATGAPVIASATEAPCVDGRTTYDRHSRRSEPCPVDRTVEDGDIVKIGNMEWHAIMTPGHTPGSMCLYLEPTAGQEGAPILISGDTVFAGRHGRDDFPEGNADDMRASLTRLAALPPETIVLTGHNDLTTIARESSWLPRC